MTKTILLLFILICTTPCAHAWSTKTPLGITIIASNTTIAQYKAHWATWDEDPDVILFPKRPGIFAYYKPYRSGPKWKDIDWSVIDNYFVLLRSKYQSYPDSSTLTIEIMPIDYSCRDESAFPYSYEYVQPGYGCIDGQYFHGNLIRIHLGDDSGQEWWGQINRPFCATALPWELFHYFLYWSGDPCWWNEFDSYCQTRYMGVEELCIGR